MTTANNGTAIADPAIAAAPGVDPNAAPAPAPEQKQPEADPSKLPTLDAPEAEAEVIYEPTDDPGLDLALAFVGRFGITADHPAMLKAQEGDFSHLETLFSVMKDPAAKDWQKYLALGKAAFERQTEAKTATAKQVNAVVEEAAGGAEQWAEIQTWARQNADADERAAINSMFEAGPIQARLATVALRVAWEQSAQANIEPARVSTPNSARANAAASGQPLSQVEYANEVQALVRKYGSRNIEANSEYQALSARYLASKR